MGHTEIKLLLSYLENNREYLSILQNEFVLNMKNQYKWTGIITNGQLENLEDIKERIPSIVEVE
jgi:hypothetical protein